MAWVKWRPVYSSNHGEWSYREVADNAVNRIKDGRGGRGYFAEEYLSDNEWDPEQLRLPELEVVDQPPDDWLLGEADRIMENVNYMLKTARRYATLVKRRVQ